MEEDKYIKKQKVYKIIMLIVLTAFITFLVTSTYILNNFDGVNGNSTLSSLISNSNNDDELTKTLKGIEEIIDKYYLKDVDEQKAIDGAIQGYIEALGDEYTEYIPADEMKEYTQDIMGNFVGIGIYMIQNTEENTIEVLSPIKDSPAEKAGILAGDIIVGVDGVNYTGDEIDTVANNIKGEEGTTVKIEIRRGEENLTFDIERAKVITNPVLSEKLENNIGYLQITSFDEGTAEDFKNKFNSLKDQGITSLIIDLRNNGGGIVEEAIEIIDYIVPKGKEILITVDKEQKEEIEKSKDDILIDMPIVVLVNEYSASASEIVAGALKDLNEATLVGKTTYGKGVIQQLLSLSNGAGLKVTVEEYYTPNRTKIDGVGIKPNEEVNLPETVTSPLIVTREQDTQLQKAIEILK